MTTDNGGYRGLVAESEHTPPSAWCPDPELWHSYDGGDTEYEVAGLLQGLVYALQPETVVEVGCYLGHTSARIGIALARNGHGRLVTMDTVKARCANTYSRCNGLPVTVLHLAGLEYVPRDPIDLLFLDGDLASRPAEVEHFAPYMEQGGLIVVHDTAPHHQSPDQIRRLVGHHQYLNLRTPRGVLILQVDSV